MIENQQVQFAGPLADFMPDMRAASILLTVTEDIFRRGGLADRFNVVYPEVQILAHGPDGVISLTRQLRTQFPGVKAQLIQEKIRRSAFDDILKVMTLAQEAPQFIQESRGTLAAELIDLFLELRNTPEAWNELVEGYSSEAESFRSDRRNGEMQSNGHAFESIYRQYHPLIFRYLSRRTSDTILAEDLAHETVLKAYKALAGGNEITDSLSGWLFRIAHNLLYDHFRRKKLRRESTLSPLLQSTDAATALTRVDSEIDFERIRPALERLDAPSLEILSLRYCQDQSSAEIGEIMILTEGAVRARQFRTVRNLRNDLIAKPNHEIADQTAEELDF